jgi:hypothetical protein
LNECILSIYIILRIYGQVVLHLVGGIWCLEDIMWRVGIYTGCDELRSLAVPTCFYRVCWEANAAVNWYDKWRGRDGRMVFMAPGAELKKVS